MPSVAPIAILAQFQQELVGNWRNLDFGTDGSGAMVGGNENPLSYNIMPLPQRSDPDGYILKNFKYHEILHFNDDQVNTTVAIAAQAQNRGGQVSQNARALFYEQQVQFAEGPGINTVVHVENGAWIWLPRFVQQAGPYTDVAQANPVPDSLQQPSDTLIAKQISVPHGNSILALGTFDTVRDASGPNPRICGSPFIPDGASPYPQPGNPPGIPEGSPIPPTLRSDLNADERYTTLRDSSDDYENPHPDLTQAPNLPLQQAVAIIQPEAYMHWYVTTEALPSGQGSVTNIPFEQRVANVTGYSAEYWLLFKGANKYLAYTQTIFMVLTILDQKYVFPHVTCNTLTFVPAGM
jgi:hypothetical protein